MRSKKCYKFDKRKGELKGARRGRERVRKVKKRDGLESMKVGFWNVRTLVTLEKQQIVHDLLEKQKFDLLCLCETWFREDSKEHSFNHKGYKVMRNERSGAAKKGGGLLLLVKDNLKAVGYLPQARAGFKECS